MIIGVIGIFLFFFQVFQWHVHGVWPNFNLLWVLNFIPYEELNNWVVNPTYWQPLHDFLSLMQIWALLFVFGLISILKDLTK